MKHHSGAILIVFIGLVMWSTAFWITRTRAISRWEQDNPVWLSKVSEDLLRREDEFKQLIEQYTAELHEGRTALCRLLDDPQTPDQAIFDQADINAHVHKAIVLAVGEHLKTMGNTLPASQKTLLKQFCRQTMGGGGRQQRNRYGQRGLNGPLQNTGDEQPVGQGLRLRHRRGRCGLFQRLEMTDEQIALTAQKDPSFETEVHQLQNQVLQERQALCALLENEQTLNDQLIQQIEKLITVHNLLEKRLIRYVIIARTDFTPEQQKRLIGLCQQQPACQEPTASLKDI